MNFYSGVFRRKVCHSSSLSSSITAAVGVIRGKGCNQSFIYFFLLGKSPRHGSLEVNQLGNAGTGVSRMNLACVGREMLLADSPGVGPASLRCG